MPLDLQKLRILVVDDYKPIRDLLSAILHEFGARKISVAADGEQGFKVFQRDVPDIVLLDWDMGSTTGLDLAEKIRKDPDSVNPVVPIIMLSGYSAVFRIEGARAAGVTEFMTKPFTAEAVAKRIAYVINKPRDFVDYDDFIGPDRRRRPGDAPAAERRGADPSIIVEHKG